MPIRVGTQPILKMYAGPDIPVPSWSPADFTNVQYWWTADAGITESGGNLTSWEDQINGFIVSGSNNPQYTTSATLNGQNVVQTNGTNNFVSSHAAPANGISGNDITFLSVINLVDVKSGGAIGGAVLFASGNRFWYDTLSGNIRVFDNGMPGGGGQTLEASPVATGAKFIKARYDSSAGALYGAIDTLTETSLFTGGTTGTYQWSTANGGPVVAMGASAQSVLDPTTIFGGRYVQMEVAEHVWIYDEPSSAEMNEWKTYVNNKYGTIIS